MLVELARAFAADEQPVVVVGRVGVQEAHFLAARHPAAPARQEVVRRGIRGDQLTYVHGVEDQVDRGQVFVVGDHLLGHGQKFGRMRRDDLGDPDPDRRGPPDEVDVLELALHHVGEHAVALMLERHRGERGGVAHVGVRVGDPGRGLRAGQHPQLRHRGEQRAGIRGADRHERGLITLAEHQERGPPVDLPVAQQLPDPGRGERHIHVLHRQAAVRPGDRVGAGLGDHASAPIM